MKRANKLLGFSMLMILAGISMIGCITESTRSFKEPISGVTYNIAIPAKNIQIIGIVRVEAKVDTYSNGELITYDALLKAAEAAGGNGITNIMIDRLQQSKSSDNIVNERTTTWYGSALAIRYTNENLPAYTPMSFNTTNLGVSIQNNNNFSDGGGQPVVPESTGQRGIRQ